MTLPTNIILPIHSERIRSGNPEDLERYLRDLNFELQRMYEDIAYAVNGSIKSDVYTQREQWTPTLKGTTTAGTFTYTHQTGYVYRQGILVDVWFDILWTNQVGSVGNLYIELPYRVALSSNKPFCGVLQTATLTYSGGVSTLTCNAIPDTFRCEIWQSGSGIATSNLGIVNSGQLIGHIRYLGQSDERS